MHAITSPINIITSTIMWNITSVEITHEYTNQIEAEPMKIHILILHENDSEKEVKDDKQRRYDLVIDKMD